MTRRDFAAFAAAPFLSHTPLRNFIGPAVYEARPGLLRMIAPWGRPPVDFSEAPEYKLAPLLYESRDEGGSWREAGRLKMKYALPGMISDGGISWIRLKDGRQMLTFHRNMPGFHGGGVPAVSFSQDGKEWTAARRIVEVEHVYYLMNERTIQLSNGTLLIPVAMRPEGEQAKYTEGDVCLAACFYSEDAGITWQRGAAAQLDDVRGMAEPAIVERGDGKILMLARTGKGAHYASLSADRGKTWTSPAETSLRAACSPLTLKKLSDGRLIVAYNHATALTSGAFFPRTPLSYSVSADDGLSWSPPVTIEAGPGRQRIYPSITERKGKLLFVYSEHNDRGDGGFGQPKDAWKLGGACMKSLALPAADLSRRLPNLPQGIAGQFVGVLNDRLIVAGGTFWSKPKWEGGVKSWVRTIWSLARGAVQWEPAGELPEDLAYGVAATIGDAVYCFGGQSASAVSNAIVQLRWLSGKVIASRIGDLPESRCNWGGIAQGNSVYLCGGQASPDGPSLRTFWHWHYSRVEVLPDIPGPGRILPAVIVSGNDIAVLSGAAFSSERTYLKDRWHWTAAGGWRQGPDLPVAAVAASTLTASDGRSLLLSGDDGRLAPQAAELKGQHPGFSCDVVDVTDGWQPVAVMKTGLVTTGAVLWGNEIIVAGGEARPGTRSNEVVRVIYGNH